MAKTFGKTEKKQTPKTNAKQKAKYTPKKNNKNQKTTNKKAAPKTAKRTYKKSSAPKNTKPIKIIPLGGLDEIGKNITLYAYGDDMFLVDCGMSFPDEETPGIDIVIPDFTFVLENKDKIKGLVLTHGHEDHIGAIPYLLKNFNVPIYGTRLTLGLVEGKLKEHRLDSSAKLNVVKPGDIIKLGAFSVEFIHVNHSIPDAVAVAVRCPAGLIVQTGDFKIDATPIDDYVIDMARFAELGKEGVLALLSDSTNAERPGFTASERIVGESFANLFAKAGKHRIIVATFSSNIHRIQQIIDEAVRCGRKVAVSGRSMINVVNIAAELGYLNVYNNVLIDIDAIKKYNPEQLVIITTGSQGEPMSALHRIAAGEHRNVDIVPGDMIIISATPIPGNEKLVGKVINVLMKRGANVVYEKMYDVHVSGHACQDELKLMLSIIKPKYFIPVHGEQKHLVKHSALAQSVGVDDKNIIVATNGNVIELNNKGIKIAETVQAGRVLVDGLGVGDVGSIVLRDRIHLAEHGIIIIVLAMDAVSGEVVSGPDIVSRGFVYVKESEELMSEITELSCDILEKCYLSNIYDRNAIKGKLRDGVSRYLYEKTRRSPMILPIIMEV
ncbi:MAG: RNase J family beta-CASP ribonuclease [Ruminococcaceae bacterium]|nr:RNase J family beta-CASP ribonuclease [Oscillospiraceae bacterium]